MKVFQKQPLRGVPRKRCSENMQQIYKRTPIPKCSNFIEITFRPGCSPVCSHEPPLEVICWIALILITNLERYYYSKSVQRLLLIRAYNYCKLGHIYYKLGQLIQIGTIIANQSTTPLISGGDINCLCGKLSKVTLLIEFI